MFFYYLNISFILIFVALSGYSNAATIDISIPQPKQEQQKPVEEVKSKNKLPESHPEITIYGKKVVVGKKNSKPAPKTVEELPVALQQERIKAALAMRKNITTYNHNPSYGNADAPLEIIEMTDLNCLQCMEFVKKVDDILQDKKYQDKIKYTHIHLPVDLYNSTNPAAFYGKIAQQIGVFWQYRKEIFSIKEVKDSTFIDKLVAAGANPNEIRKLARSDARKFYKELDADALLTKQMGETKPPVLFVNGVNVGYNIKIEELADLLNYELGIK